MRCITLAIELQQLGWNCVFACAPKEFHIPEALLGGRFPCFKLSGNLTIDTALLANLPSHTADLLIVDHYDWTADHEAACYSWAKNILAIDDLANRTHSADILLDQTFGRTQADYADLVKHSTKLLLGSEYALLRNEFRELRATALKRRKQFNGVKRVLVNFGGADRHNMTSLALEAIKVSGLNIHVDVIIGQAAQNVKSVKQELKSLPQTTSLHVATHDMGKLMAQADIAIGANGTTSWERCCLGLPSLTICTAENQRKISNQLSMAGAAIVMGEVGNIDRNIIANHLEWLLHNPEKLSEMSRSAALICDGNGARRIAEEIARESAR